MKCGTKLMLIGALLSGALCAVGSAVAADDSGFPDRPPVAPLQKGIKLPEPFTKTLANGLDIIVISNDEIPMVWIGAYMLAGAKFDPRDKPGVASLTVKMLREGTKNFHRGGFSEILESSGLSLSSGANHESSFLLISGLAIRRHYTARLLADAVRRANFPRGVVEQVRDQTSQNKSVTENDGSYQAGRTLTAWTYGDHYLSRPATGTSRNIARIIRDDLVAFQKAHYAPNRTTLVFSGDISSDVAVALAEEYFGDWKRGPAEPVVPSGKISDDDTTRIVIVDRATAQQVQIRLGHLGFKRSDPDYVTSRVFNQVFGGSFVSRLNKRIRVEEGLTYGARGGFSAGKEPGLLTVRTFTRPEGVGDTVRALLEELEKIREIAPTDEELADAKSYIIGSFGLSMETAEDVAGKVWDLKFHGLPFDYYEGYLKQIEQISSEQIQAFARKHVHPDKIKIVIVGREADIRPHVESIAPITVIKPGEKVPRQKAKRDPS